MANLNRCYVTWSGLAGLPGVSVFYGVAGGDPTGSLTAWFTAMQSVFPAGLSWTIPGSGDTIEDTTGDLVGGWTGAGGATVAASGSAAHASGCGAYVNWGTAAIINDRRLRGRTFLAPLMNSAYDNAGTIVTGNLTTLQNAANTLVGTADIAVWHRPTTSGGSDGQGEVITSAQIPDQVTSLRTRRR